MNVQELEHTSATTMLNNNVYKRDSAKFPKEPHVSVDKRKGEEKEN